MVASSTVFAVLANIFITGSLAAAVPDVALEPRGGGLPSSNPEGVTCFNTWETVTNDPVVQYWYVVVKDAENSIKANRVWNHLNLNGCAPTEHKYYAQEEINGCALTFHTSEACTADRVSKALRSGSDPGQNIACQFTDKKGTDPTEAALKSGDAVFQGILQALGGFGRV